MLLQKDFNGHELHRDNSGTYYIDGKAFKTTQEAFEYTEQTSKPTGKDKTVDELVARKAKVAKTAKNTK